MLENFNDIPARDRVIVAIDCGIEEAFDIADKLQGKAKWMKVGMTLFYANGPAIVYALKERGFKVFLDLKFHDIPHQVEGAAYSACASGADMMTMHTTGGVAMMSAAQKGAERAAAEYGFEVADFTDHDYDRYFLRDQTHPSPLGAVYYSEAIYKFLEK